MNAINTTQGMMAGAGGAGSGTPSSAAPFGTFRPTAAAGLFWRIAMNNGLVKAFRKDVRRRAVRWFPGPYDVTAEGFDWRLMPSVNYCDRVLMARRRFPEVEERAALINALQPGEVFVDVGANIGTYTLDASRRVGDGGRVVAIEPNPDTFARLTAHLALNRAGNVSVCKCAISSQAGSVRLWLNAGSNIGQSSLIAAGAGRPERNVEVPAKSLRALLAEEGIDRIDAIKVDVEGYEDRVLMPLLETADTGLTPRLIQIETVHRDLWERDCIDALKSAGFSTLLTTDENEILQRPA